MKKKLKAILVGNGFSSQLIPEYRNEVLKERLYSMIPQTMVFLDTFWDNIYTVFGEHNLSTGVWRNYDLEWDDGEFCYPIDTGLHINKFSNLKNLFAHKMHSIYSVPAPASVRAFNEYFSNYYSCLRHQINNPSIIAIEPLYSLGTLACKLGIFSDVQTNELSFAIKTVLRNGDSFTFDSVDAKRCINGSGSYSEKEIKQLFKSNMQNFFQRFAVIYTTNYDLLLEDLVSVKILHVHGKFSPKPASSFSGTSDILLNDCIILGNDGYKKQQALRKRDSQQYIKYLNSLRYRQIDELHIFGYSGTNDQHINQNFTHNPRIKKIYYYGDPNLIQKDFKDYKDSVLYCLGLYEDTRGKEVYIKGWDEIWNYLYVK